MANQIFEPLPEELAKDRADTIRSLLAADPSLKDVTTEDLISWCTDSAFKPDLLLPYLNGLRITITMRSEKRKSKPFIVHGFRLVLIDSQHRLDALDKPRWTINIGLWCDRETDDTLRLYHDGDNSFTSKVVISSNHTIRDQTYGKGAKFSITKVACDIFPCLYPDTTCLNWPTYQNSEKDHCFVNLGTIPAKGPITKNQFIDMRQRLVLYRLSRWFWLKDYPLQ